MFIQAFGLLNGGLVTRRADQEQAHGVWVTALEIGAGEAGDVAGDALAAHCAGAVQHRGLHVHMDEDRPRMRSAELQHRERPIGGAIAIAADPPAVL